METRTGLAKLIHSNLRKVTDIKEAKANADALIAKEAHTVLSAEELLEIGLSLLEEGKKHQDTIPYFKRALGSTPSDVVAAECHYGLAVALHQDPSALDHFTFALAGCQKFRREASLECTRLQSKIFRNIGLYYLPKEQFTDAAFYFKRSLEVAAESNEQLKGFIPAMTAYYALALSKQCLYEEGAKLFAEADQLYKQFPESELNVSMDYASYFTHMGRIYLQRKDAKNAVTALERGYHLRLTNLRAENPVGPHEYSDDRIGAAASLLSQAKTMLSELEKPQTSVTTLAQSGSPFHHQPSAIEPASNAELGLTAPAPFL